METSILRLTVAGLALAAGLASPPAAARQSEAPDLGGYTYIDSRESGGPVFDYVDISSSATATRLDLDDDEVAEGIPLGFTFNFYGIDYEEVAISSNGNLAFGAATDYWNEDVLPIPQPAGTDDWQNPPFVAPWFGDLCPSCGDEGAIFYATLGEAPNRRFVVQYRVPPYPGYGNETLDFQVILYEGSNEILFQYRDTTVGDPWEDHGFYATVGIQGTDDAGLNYSAGEAVIEDGLAIRFLPPAGPFIGLNAPADRWAAPGKTVTYRFTLANGTGADAEFTVSLSGHGWQASASPDHMMVAAGDTASFDVTVTVPAKAELTALADRLTVTVSGNDTSASRSVTTRTAPIEQLTYGDRDSEEPSLSADGSKVAFVSWADLLEDGSNADGTRELFVMNTDGTGLKQLTFISDERAWAEQPSLSADGSRVAFVSLADLLGDGSNADGSRELFVMNTDGTGLTQLTYSDGDSEEPSLSADGNRVVFVSNADLLGDGSNADGSWELFVMNTDGTGLRQLTSISDGEGWVEQPSLSADGNRVAFVSDADLLGDGSNADGSWELFVINTDGTGLKQLTSSGGSVWFWIMQPSLSADGSRVAFSSNIDLLGDGSNPDGGFQIFVINTDGTGLIQVTTGGFVTEGVIGSYTPSLSADGSKVAFAANVDLLGDDPGDWGNSQIYVADLTQIREGTEWPGSGGTRLVSGGGGAFGWLSLLGGALLALRRRRVVLALLAGMTLAAPASAEWYAGAMVGRAIGDTDSGDVTAALEAAGIDAMAEVKDRTRTAWRLFGGYRWNNYLAVEGGYTDLGKITTRFAASGSVTLEQLGDDRPASGKGVELAVVGSYPLSDSIYGYARFGLWRWKAEYDLRGAVDESDTERGTDPVLGLGIEARLAAAWALRLGWDRYRVDSEDHDFFGLGLLYRFGEE